MMCGRFSGDWPSGAPGLRWLCWVFPWGATSPSRWRGKIPTGIPRQRGIGRIYDQYFARLLREHVRLWQQANPEAPTITFQRPPRSIEEFDDVFTAPLGGFASAVDYYQKSSAAQFVPSIQTPTLIIAAQDDPMVDPRPLQELPHSPAVSVHLAEGGGHMGFVSQGQPDPDGWWLDWRAVEWVTHFQLSHSDSQGLPKTVVHPDPAMMVSRVST
jgi:predicted alpha/beta-fold hydrolase